MKKTLSIIMALCMVLGLCSFSVAAAPEGTAITDAAGFAAMEPNGTYYLANDITIAEPYAQSFVGTLDGNGKTVTISQPMFFDFGGTIKNLTVEGSVTSLAADAEIVLLNADGARGAVACRVNSGTEVLFENVVNNASVSAIGNLSGDDCSGAMVGKVECEGVNVKFVNCVNNGAITGLNQVGGIAGWVKTAASATFENCVNNGAISESGSSAYCAGIVCRADAPINTFTGCTNTAKISSGKDQAGGMLAYASKGSFVFENCVNKGEIAPTVGKAAGIAGNINCNDADGNTGYSVTFKGCANYGNITAGGDGNYAAGIVGSSQKNLNTLVTNCVNYGEINGTHDSGGIVGHSTQAIMKISYCENFGKVTTISDQYAGGICGYAWGTKTASVSAADGTFSNIIEYCINHAEVTGDTRSGGIVGSTGTSDSRGISLVNYCINLGNVTLMATKDNFSLNCASGIMAYGYGTEDTAYPMITNCVTVGDITAKNASGNGGTAGYFLGYVNSTLAVVQNNVALGTLTSEGGFIAALGRNNEREFKAENLTGNALPEGATYQLTYENAITDKAYETKTTDAAALTSGKTVYEFNESAKADVIYMTVDGTFAPTLIAAEDGSNSIVKNADGTYGNPVKEPETTEPAPETTEPGSSSDTGDSFAIFAIIAVISVLGVAVVAKRREN